MREFLNDFLERYVYYKPTIISDYLPENLDVEDKRLHSTAAEQLYDPNFGFGPSGRKERKALATPEEVFSAQVPNRRRDYCAHHYIRFKACKRDKMLSFFGCLHYQEELGHCIVQDAILNQKEFERENRLTQRNRRIKRMELGLERD